jgi:hypothetical protein
MKCQCSNLPESFYLDEGPKEFEKALHQEDAQNWRTLYSCPQCGTLWVIDVWDKGQERVVIRVKERTAWTSEQRTDERKRLLLQSRGGTTNDTCVWSGCNGKRVKGVAYCLDHLWNTGARR